ncbi:MAG: WYL domain-containing transcriptional regulator [Bacteroidaceae bacterium]|nr:WYL domain-containing transcriptional regulator [Bacteroidaceae bacterium]
MAKSYYNKQAPSPKFNTLTNTLSSSNNKPMSLNLIQQQLKMLCLLVNKGPLSVEDLARKLDISARKVYRNLEELRDIDLEIIKEGTKYSINPQSPYLNELLQGIRFSNDEAITILNVLNSVTDRSPEVRHLHNKLSSLYHKRVLAPHSIDTHTAANLAKLYEAVQTEQMVCLHNYCSPSSGKVSDRMVEPFLFLANNTEVRCFEVATMSNKTFKIARAESVEIIDLCWSYKDRHTSPLTDIFHFTGEQTMHVALHMGALAKNVLLEEYPEAEKHISPLGNEHYRLDVEVCSFKGIGRFVLGLYEDIHILENDEFKAYIVEQIRKMAHRHNIIK